METITYRLDQFEGPLDLLLTLIQKNKFDIADIPIAIICDQYIDYIEKAASHDLDVSSDFIVMASRLMLIKSRMLLPKPEDETEDPREDLARAVLEYARAKEAAGLLSGMYSMHGGRMVKDTDEIKPDKTIHEHDMSLLSAALYRVLSETRAVEASAVRFTPLIRKRTMSAAEKAVTVVDYMRGRGEVSAEELFSREATRTDMITVFLALLELLRSQQIAIVEDDKHNTDDGTLEATSLSFVLVESDNSGENNAEDTTNTDTEGGAS